MTEGGADSKAGPTVLDVWRDRPGFWQARIVNLIGASLFGLTALLCDPGRFAAPTWNGLRESLGVGGWGCVLLAYALGLVALRWLSAAQARLVFSAGGVVYLAIGIYFAVGLGDPHAAPWGPIFGALLGAWQFGQAEAYRQAAR